MNISQVMTPAVKIISPTDSLQSAALLMRENDFGLLPVEDGERLIGMLTDRDITIRAVAEGLSPAETEVQEVMTTEVEFIFDDYPVEEAARYMSELQVRRLPVVDRDHRLVGIVSLGDIALSEQQSAGAALSSISQSDEAMAYST